MVIVKSKIYYLKVQISKSSLIIDQIYLLEDIPNKDDLSKRIDYFINDQSYEKANPKLSKLYLKKIKTFVILFLNFMKPNDQKCFIDLTHNGRLHPDLITFSTIIKTMVF